MKCKGTKLLPLSILVIFKWEIILYSNTIVEIAILKEVGLWLAHRLIGIHWIIEVMLVWK